MSFIQVVDISPSQHMILLLFSSNNRLTQINLISSPLLSREDIFSEKIGSVPREKRKPHKSIKLYKKASKIASFRTLPINRVLEVPRFSLIHGLFHSRNFAGRTRPETAQETFALQEIFFKSHSRTRIAVSYIHHQSHVAI